MSLPEIVMWQALRGGKLSGLRFRRQHAIGPYILDFYCASARLAVEIDGESHGHAEQVRHDASRDRWLASQEVRVLRFAAKDVLKDERLADLLDTILAAAQTSAPSTALRAVPLPRFAEEEPEPAARRRQQP